MSKSTLTRRALVASTAAVPAAAALGLPVAQAAAEPDPIFGAMKKYLAREQSCDAWCSHEDDLRKSGQKLTPAPGEYSRTRETVTMVNAAIAAREELAATSPTTLASLAAYLDFVVAQSEALSGEDAVFIFDGDEETLPFARALAQSVSSLARAQS